MATTTFPALDIRPMQSQQQQIDPLGQMAKMMALRSSMLEYQQQQMGMQSQQALMQAYQQANGDPDQTVKYAVQSGKVLPGQLLQFQQASMKYRQDLAGLTKDQLQTMQTQHAELRNAIDPIMQLPPEQQVPAANKFLGQLGAMNPQQRQLQYGLTDQQLSQLPPGGITSIDQLKTFEATLSGSEKAIDTQLKQAQTAETQQKTLTEIAKRPEETWKAYEAQDQQVRYFNWLKDNPGGTLPQFLAQDTAVKTAAETTAREQAAFPYQAKLAAIRQNIEMEFWNQKDVRTQIESKYLQPYETKMASIQELNSAVDQAQAGNVAAARGVVLKLIGVANPDGTKKYSTKEAQQFMDMGGVPDRLRGTVQNLLTGDQWTPKMAADIKSYGAAQGQVAEQSLDSGISNVNKLHNTHVGGGLTGGGARPPGYQPPAPTTAAPTKPRPPGATGTAMGPDGKLHWVNKAQRQDLGPAQ